MSLALLAVYGDLIGRGCDLSSSLMALGFVVGGVLMREGTAAGGGVKWRWRFPSEGLTAAFHNHQLEIEHSVSIFMLKIGYSVRAL